MITPKEMAKVPLIVGLTYLLSACVADTEDHSSSLSSTSSDSSASSEMNPQTVSSASVSFAASSSSNAATLPEPLATIDPYPTLVSRLSNDEYNNTLRDLLYPNGTTHAPFEYGHNMYNSHDSFGRFSNEAKALKLTADHLEAYYQAATEIAIQAGDGQFPAAIPCSPSDSMCADTVINRFAPRAWRRPLTTEDKNQLYILYNDTLADAQDPTVALITLVRALLISPNFIFRPEIDPNLTSPEARDLTPYELASRLSYFIWASMPDDTLFAAAADGSLTDDAVLRAQVARMLDDKKAKTLVTIFAEGWFDFSLAAAYRQDSELFPSYTDALAENFVQESHRFIEYMLKENRPFTDLANAKYTFLNASLAEHYGVSGYTGHQFQLHQWGSNSPRSGLLGHSSILTGHSYWAEVTNPIQRGMWVVDKLLCDRPPEEPGDILTLFREIPEGLNPRETLEIHTNPNNVCRACHSFMDPIGFALESFDPIGRLRDTYPDGNLVETSAKLPAGEAFSGSAELGDILAKKPELAACSIQHTMSYALGREIKANSFGGAHINNADYSAIYQVYQKTKNNDHRVRDVITEIVLSPVFRQRRGADSVNAGAQ